MGMLDFKFGEMEMLDFMIATPKRHILARNRVFWHVLRQIDLGALAVASCKNPPKKRKNGKKLAE